jgi:hypothetical protein
MRLLPFVAAAGALDTHCRLEAYPGAMHRPLHPAALAL